MRQMRVNNPMVKLDHTKTRVEQLIEETVRS